MSASHYEYRIAPDLLIEEIERDIKINQYGFSEATLKCLSDTAIKLKGAHEMSVLCDLLMDGDILEDDFNERFNQWQQ